MECCTIDGRDRLVMATTYHKLMVVEACLASMQKPSYQKEQKQENAKPVKNERSAGAWLLFYQKFPRLANKESDIISKNKTEADSKGNAEEISTWLNFVTYLESSSNRNELLTALLESSVINTLILEMT